LKKGTNLDIARSHLKLAFNQWDQAAIHSWEPSEPAQCVTLVFYAYENAVVAAAEAVGHKWKKTHPSKAEVAGDLVKQKKLKTNVADRLERLNTLRKDVSYGEPGEDLSRVNLEAVVGELENFVQEVEDLISDLEDELEE
jgi:hypothetical protein